ncbi:SDR family oxidoreductase [uncultured Psychrobacter sp.]|uniref:SDR family oxidoreductase n=1 Tax=uncultured Psychrobacter sp. TaxID=259303 RepID=UPI0025962156|nr:SDR family oxidoreductase [uncultured Psychrobacter sp.]
MTRPNPKANAYTVLIGATGGIGQEIAKQLCASSRPVILVGRNTQKLTEIHRGLAQDYSNLEIQSFECDLSVPTSQDELMAALNHLIMHPTNNRPNRIDTVILNAGINDFAMLTDQSDDLLEQMMLVNVAYPMQLIKRLLPILIAQNKPAQIINIGSPFGSIGYPGFSAYSASKFALRGATEALGREYSDTSIRFRYFAPRATKTTMNNDAVVAINNELKVNMDPPDTVAKALVEFLSTKETSQHLGFPERLFAWLNRVFPSIVGNAIIKDLPTIKRYARK